MGVSAKTAPDWASKRLSKASKGRFSGEKVLEAQGIRAQTATLLVAVQADWSLAVIAPAEELNLKPP